MPYTILDPTSTYGTNSVVTVGGAALPHEAVGDNSNVTYVKRANTNYNPMLQVQAVLGALGPGEDMFAVREILRASKTTSGQPLQGWLEIYGSRVGVANIAVPHGGGGVVSDLSYPFVLFGQDLPAIYPPFNVLMAMHDPDTPGTSMTVWIYECHVEVATLLRAEAPVIAVIDADASGSPVEGTQTPEFALEVDAIVEGWQNLYASALPQSLLGRVQARLFGDDAWEDLGFDPEWTEAVQETAVDGVTWEYGDGETPSTASVAFTLPAALPFTGTFRLYARVQRGLERDLGWGEWGYLEFVMDVEPAAAPTIVATTDGQEVEIDVTPIAVTMHDDPLITIDRSSDAGATWTRVRGATDLPGAYGVATTVIDNEAPRGLALTYRAKVKDSTGAAVFESAWSTDAADAIVGSGWNLRSATSPELNIYGLNVVGHPTRKRKDDVAVLYPKGRTRPVVVSSGSFGYAGTLEVRAQSAADIAALEALLVLEEPLYLEDGFGSATWIRINEPEHTLLGTAAKPRRRYSLPYLEVARPEE